MKWIMSSRHFRRFGFTYCEVPILRVLHFLSFFWIFSTYMPYILCLARINLFQSLLQIENTWVNDHTLMFNRRWYLVPSIYIHSRLIQHESKAMLFFVLWIPNKSLTFFILFWDFFPTYMALLGPAGFFGGFFWEKFPPTLFFT